jgi:tol-pal system protein YbgF
MSKILKSSFVLAMLLSTALISPAHAQSADTNGRLNQMEEQMRTLVGQVEELTFTVKQLQGQLAAGRKTGDLEPAQMPAKPMKRAAQAAPSAQPVEEVQQQASVDGGGVEQIQDVEASAEATDQTAPVMPKRAQGAKMLGALGTSKPAAEPNDGGFQGQVLVAPGGEGQPQAQAQGQDDGTINSGSIETVSIASETPEGLYERSNESLLRRQFGDAEQGFRLFIEKYPDHNLAGSAQYWLGETYYAQGDYREAAKNFLSGYKRFPKSRRAPDSLLKLGVSLNKLGQTQQACASLGAVGSQYPNAVDAKKRAQAEFRRAGC